MEKNIYDIIIIGGGAAGMACAVSAARAGKKTLVLEKGEKPGRKLLASGNGRCNISNLNVSEKTYYGDKKFIKEVLSGYGAEEIEKFLFSLGIILKEEEGGRLFPVTGRADSVLNAFKMAMEENGAAMYLSSEVIKIEKQKDIFELSVKNGKKYSARHVALACGSKAYPKLGADDSGYRLAAQAGHKITPLYPALTALNLNEDIKKLKPLHGLRTTAEVSVFTGGKLAGKETGEIIFSGNGLSGIPVLTLSRLAAVNGADIQIDFIPYMKKKELEIYLKTRAASMPERKMKDFFTGFLHDGLAEYVLNKHGVAQTALAGRIKENVWAEISEALKGMFFKNVSARGFDEASCTAGGVDVKEINPRTLMSQKIKNLFIIGEMLDADGYCGGFNLHFALACGVRAAESIK